MRLYFESFERQNLPPGGFRVLNQIEDYYSVVTVYLSRGSRSTRVTVLALKQLIQQLTAHLRLQLPAPACPSQVIDRHTLPLLAAEGMASYAVILPGNCQPFTPCVLDLCLDCSQTLATARDCVPKAASNQENRTERACLQTAW